MSDKYSFISRITGNIVPSTVMKHLSIGKIVECIVDDMNSFVFHLLLFFVVIFVCNNHSLPSGYITSFE